MGRVTREERGRRSVAREHSESGVGKTKRKRVRNKGVEERKERVD